MFGLWWSLCARQRVAQVVVQLVFKVVTRVVVRVAKNVAKVVAVRKNMYAQFGVALGVRVGWSLCAGQRVVLIVTKVVAKRIWIEHTPGAHLQCESQVGLKYEGVYVFVGWSLCAASVHNDAHNNHHNNSSSSSSRKDD